MRSIVIINQKGGVGKTTTVANLGVALSRRSQRVLLIDLDPQAHLTQHLGLDQTGEEPTVYDLLTDSAPVEKVRRQLSDTLWVIGSEINLAAAEVELAGVVGREMILRDALDGDPADYDFVLMDCPPSLGVLTLNGMATAKEVLIPLQPHFLALQGMGKLLETVGLVANRINSGLVVSGVLCCMHETGTRLAAEVIENVRTFLEQGRDRNTPWSQARVFDTIIRRNVKLAESPSFGLSIFDYAPASNGAADYNKLADELLGVSDKSESVKVLAGDTCASNAEVPEASLPKPLETRAPVAKTA